MKKTTKNTRKKVFKVTTRSGKRGNGGGILRWVKLFGKMIALILPSKHRYVTDNAPQKHPDPVVGRLTDYKKSDAWKRLIKDEETRLGDRIHFDQKYDPILHVTHIGGKRVAESIKPQKEVA